MNSKRRSTRRPAWTHGPGFLVVAAVIAVAIFAITKFVQYELHPKRAPTQQKTQAPESATAAIASAGDSLKGFEVVLWRQGCATGCPDYALHYASGKLHYTGISGVQRRGNLSVDFHRPRQEMLLRLVEKSSFFTLGDDYSLKNRKCHPSKVGAAKYVIGVTLNGQTKKVVVNEGCTNIPGGLSALADGIDKLAQSRRWTGVGAVQAGSATTAEDGGS